MSYSYAQINQFANLISSRLHLRPASYEYHHWYEVQAKLRACSEALQKGATTSLRYSALNEYCTAIARAKAYLIKKDRQSIFPKCLDSDDRNNYLDQCIDWALRYFNACKRQAPDFWQGIVAPTKSVAVPAVTQPMPRNTSAYNPGLFDKIIMGVTKVIRDNTVDSFVASPAFQRLKTYYSQSLVNDTRDHSFLGLSLRVEKAPVLKVFLDRLETAQTMVEVHQVFTDFYRRKQGAYAMLNAGQNITTRLLNALGMRSTTVYLIDELYETLQPQTVRLGLNRAPLR